jgi:hypothetical protein
MGADALASRPSVFAISACDSRARLYRSSETMVSLLGPALALSAPGEIVMAVKGQIADDTSLASALAAGALACVLAYNPDLTLSELRRVLRATTDVPLTVEEPDVPREGDAVLFNQWDRGGQNFKLGHGRVNVKSAVLAAADPVCQALLATSLPAYPNGDCVPPPGKQPREPLVMKMMRSWLAILGRYADRPLVTEYLRRRGDLARALLSSPTLHDAAGWLARHLRALKTDGSPAWPEPEINHRALLERVLLLLEVVQDELPPELSSLRDWAAALAKEVERAGDQAVAAFLAQAFLIGVYNPPERRGEQNEGIRLVPWIAREPQALIPSAE